LVSRIVELFDFEKGTVLDGTVGQAGHALAILESRPGLRLVGVDRDPQALEVARRRLQKFSDRVVLLHASFAELDRIREAAGEDFVAMLLDLGVSLDQLKAPDRGFSFQEPGPLDMRFDPSQQLTAYEVVNRWPERELERIFRDYGEERKARAVAAAIVRARQKKPIESTDELARIVARVVRGGRRIHPATRVFMAIRIAVNDELGHLERFLQRFPEFVARGGRVAIISFHSLEDRLVKRRFVQLAREGFQSGDEVRKFELVFKKPVVPAAEEIAANPRARSAKLRAIERAA